MGRDPRHLPESAFGRTLVELTTRTIQGRYLLRPSGELNRITVGIVARAQRLSGADVHALTYLSNHGQLLASFTDVQQMATFQGYVNGNLAREVNRIHDWGGSVWNRRYRSIPVSDEESAQVARLKYILGQGCLKEGLVGSPLDWPGTTSTHELYNGYRAMTGVWIDREAMFRQKMRREKIDIREFTSEEVLKLSPIPAWAHLTPHQYRDAIRDLVQEIVAETRAHNQAVARTPLGAERVQQVHPHTRPKNLDRSPAPRFHAKSREAWLAMCRSFSEFLARYREAAEKLRAGDTGVEFPDRCFPPRLGFTHPKLVPD